jgi:single-strand DNA-binding protein
MDGQGNWQDSTEWHNLVAFDGTAGVVRDYVRKNSQLLIEGLQRLEFARDLVQ